MTTLQKIGVWVGLGLVALGSLLGFISFFTKSSGSFGAVNPTTQQGEVYNNSYILAGGVQIGPAPASLINNALIGTCPLIGVNASIAASTSVSFDCAVPGALKGDYVIAKFATSTAVGAGWLITGSSASTTAGFLTFNVVNNTGVSAYPPRSVASTTQFIDLR